MWFKIFCLFQILQISVNSNIILKEIIRAENNFVTDKDLFSCTSTIAFDYFYRREYISLIIVYKDKRYFLDNDIDSLLKIIQSFGGISIFTNKNIRFNEVCKNFIIIIKNVETFKNILDFIPPKYFNYNGRIIIILKTKGITEKEKLKDVRKILDECLLLNIINVVVLVNINNFITIFSFFPYKENNCNTTNLVVMNRCTGKGFENKSNIFPSKVKMLHGCPLRVSMVPRYPHVVVDILENEEIVGGMEGNLIKILSNIMNFSIIWKKPKVLGWGRFDGKKWIGLVGDLIYDNADMGIGAYCPTSEQSTILDISYSYDVAYLIWILPRLEKIPIALTLFLPFKIFVWILTISTFVFLIVIMYILKKIFNDGTLDIRQLILSLWEITLGLSFTYMTKSRFIGTIFVLWIWSSMILRTVYQSSLVGFLTHKHYDDSMKNMQDLLDKNMIIYGTPTAKELMIGVNYDKVIIEMTKRMKIIDQTTDYNSTIFEIAYAKKIGTAMVLKSRVPEINYNLHGKGYLYVLKQMYNSQPITMGLRKYSSLTNDLNTHILKIFEAGFMTKWLRDYEKYDLPLNDNLVVLQIHHLVGPFIILFIGLFISVIIFMSEILYEKYWIVKFKIK